MKECQHCKKCYSDEVNVCPTDGMPTFHTISGEPVLEGKYHLERRLGQGGMGVVYCARHSYLKTQHAIKIILPDLVGNDPQLVTRFRQEALAAAAIRHHNVVSTTDYGVALGTMPFLVMEYVEGESLHDLLTREGRLAPARAFELMAAIAGGIGAAHNQGIVHRDLKPLNIMICKGKSNMTEAVKILDFGLAKIKSGELLGSFIQAQTTGLMGSPYYMAPEQWSDEDLDGRSDIYSLGVMLFQMLAGDVPFKGSSIPAIMKKHLSDLPPSFDEMGVQIAPQLELAVRHTLEKEPVRRTPTVEAMVAELRDALGMTLMNSHAATNSAAPLSVLTVPPKARVFVDNVAVGESKPDGVLFLEGIRTGNHRLRVSHEGFEDWEDEIVCDGKPRQVVAQLARRAPPDAHAIPKPNAPAVKVAPAVHNFAGAAAHKVEAQKTTFQPPYQTGQHDSGAKIGSAPPRKAFFSPLVLTFIGISALLLLAIVGVGAWYLLGFVGRKPVISNNNTVVPTPIASPPVSPTKAEMVVIKGGSFKMGRSDGRENEQPEHEVAVKDFLMDKTEVTNAEYFAFVTETGYKPPATQPAHLAHWINDRPLSGQEQMPVRFVNIGDAEAFAEWRSKRDGARYRLPSEAEWEYAARNGAKNNLYPWGDRFDQKCAVIDQGNAETKAVGTNTCANDFGVQDLIGNVFEWTNSEAKLYPGNKGTLKELNERFVIVRGGSAFQKSSGEMAITSTFRQPIEAKKRSAELGFRLVRSPSENGFP